MRIKLTLFSLGGSGQLSINSSGKAKNGAEFGVRGSRGQTDGGLLFCLSQLYGAEMLVKGSLPSEKHCLGKCRSREGKVLFF